MNAKLVVLGLVFVGAATGVAAASDLFRLDGDDLTVRAELQHGTNPFDPDTDSDGLDDSTEIEIGSHPRDTDSDGDGLDDDVEVTTHGTDPTARDTDGDGLNDNDEVEQHETDPAMADTDDDGLEDGTETEDYGTGPVDADTDGDGLADGGEVVTHDTNLLDADTDEDGLGDGEEVNDHGTDPIDDDTDSDGVIDGQEVNEGRTDPRQADTDGDGLDDGAEGRTHDTDPLEPDTDSDGIDDGTEVDEYGSNPTEADTDGDGLRDGREVNDVGSDPTDTDTDGDGLNDGIEANPDGPLADANPLRMDVFVEVDYVAGEKPSPAELDLVRDAYADAPIDNPDGTTGITLHIVIDDEIDHAGRTDAMAAFELSSAHRDYHRFGYHHAIAVEDARNGGADVGGFAVPGRFVFQTDGNRFLRPDVAYPSRMVAKLFMHELGHSVGLAAWVYRGIDSHEVPYAGYTSVMNYNSPTDAVRYNSGEPFDDWAYIVTHLHTPATDAAEPPD